MSEQVVIGKLKNPFAIKVSASKTAIPENWDHRAMWSYLRLQYGRSVDQKIKDHFDMIETMKGNGKLSKAERKKEMKLLFTDLVDQQKKPRMMQFIFDGDRVMAVASLKHLLIPPAEVYTMAKRILAANFQSLSHIRINELSGLTYKVKEAAGMKLGLQLYGGTITTRQAISLSSWLRVEMCLNPLSWLGSGFFANLGVGGLGFERILRIKVRSDLEPRLRTAIEQALANVEVIERRVSRVEKIRLKRKEAKILMSALGISYSLGAKTIKQVLNRFRKEPKNQWGLSMAASWVAAHGNFKKTPEKQDRTVEQKLSTIAGATLLIDDMKKAKEKSLVWLKAHIKEGKVRSIDELLEDVI